MTPSSTPSVSVVICAYTQRRWERLVAAVESIRRQTVPAGEILVVVDHNPDLLAMVGEHMPDVGLFENIQRQGLSEARNSGIEAATGDVIAFLDDDAEADPDWLEHMVRGYDDRNVLGVGGAVDPVWVEGRPPFLPPEFDWTVGCTYRGLPAATAPVRNLIGANMSFRREVFDAVGGFRWEVGRIGTRPLGCEETELCIRARRRWPAGVFLYDPSARVRHWVPAERATWRYFRSRCYAEGLSKSVVAALAGSQQGLASERTYATKTLPRGVLTEFADGARRGDPFGAVRAVTIVAGVTITTAGYVFGAASRHQRSIRRTTNEQGAAQ